MMVVDLTHEDVVVREQGVPCDGAKRAQERAQALGYAPRLIARRVREIQELLCLPYAESVDLLLQTDMEKEECVEIGINIHLAQKQRKRDLDLEQQRRKGIKDIDKSLTNCAPTPLAASQNKKVTLTKEQKENIQKKKREALKRRQHRKMQLVAQTKSVIQEIQPHRPEVEEAKRQGGVVSLESAASLKSNCVQGDNVGVRVPCANSFGEEPKSGASLSTTFLDQSERPVPMFPDDPAHDFGSFLTAQSGLLSTASVGASPQPPLTPSANFAPSTKRKNRQTTPRPSLFASLSSSLRSEASGSRTPIPSDSPRMLSPRSETRPPSRALAKTSQFVSTTKKNIPRSSASSIASRNQLLLKQMRVYCLRNWTQMFKMGSAHGVHLISASGFLEFGEICKLARVSRAFHLIVVPNCRYEHCDLFQATRAVPRSRLLLTLPVVQQILQRPGMSNLRSLSLKGCCALAVKANSESKASSENSNFFALFRAQLQVLPLLSKVDITGTGLGARALFTEHRAKSVSRDTPCMCLGTGCPQKVCPPFHHEAPNLTQAEAPNGDPHSHLFCVNLCALCGKAVCRAHLDSRWAVVLECCGQSRPCYQCVGMWTNNGVASKVPQHLLYAPSNSIAIPSRRLNAQNSGPDHWHGRATFHVCRKSNTFRESHNSHTARFRAVPLHLSSVKPAKEDKLIVHRPLVLQPQEETEGKKRPKSRVPSKVPLDFPITGTIFSFNEDKEERASVPFLAKRPLSSALGKNAKKKKKRSRTDGEESRNGRKRYQQRKHSFFDDHDQAEESAIRAALAALGEEIGDDF